MPFPISSRRNASEKEKEVSGKILNMLREQYKFTPEEAMNLLMSIALEIREQITGMDLATEFEMILQQMGLPADVPGGTGPVGSA